MMFVCTPASQGSLICFNVAAGEAKTELRKTPPELKGGPNPGRDERREDRERRAGQSGGKEETKNKRRRGEGRRNKIMERRQEESH